MTTSVHAPSSDRGRRQVEWVFVGVSRFGVLLAVVVMVVQVAVGIAVGWVIWSQMAKKMVISAR